MAINIFLIEPPSNQYKIINPDTQTSFVYQPIEKEVSGENILEEIGIDPKNISLVIVNKKEKYLYKKFLQTTINDGDFIEILPFLIGG